MPVEFNKALEAEGTTFMFTHIYGLQKTPAAGKGLIKENIHHIDYLPSVRNTRGVLTRQGF